MDTILAASYFWNTLCIQDCVAYIHMCEPKWLLIFFETGLLFHDLLSPDTDHSSLLSCEGESRVCMLVGIIRWQALVN